VFAVTYGCLEYGVLCCIGAAACIIARCQLQNPLFDRKVTSFVLMMHGMEAGFHQRLYVLAPSHTSSTGFRRCCTSAETRRRTMAITRHVATLERLLMLLLFASIRLVEGLQTDEMAFPQ